MLDLRDCKIAFTGRLTTMTREQAFSLAEVFGAKTQTWITKHTDYLVFGIVEISLGKELTTNNGGLYV